MEDLPAELLSLVLERCTHSTLARMALTSRVGALRVHVALLARWNVLEEAGRRLRAASDLVQLGHLLRDLEQEHDVVVLQRPMDSCRAPHEPDLSQFRTAEAFDQALGRGYYSFRHGFRSVDSKDEKARLEVAKSQLQAYDPYVDCTESHGQLSPYCVTGTYLNCCAAVTARLHHDDFCQKVADWLEFDKSINDVHATELIGFAWQRNLNRSAWTDAQLARLIQMILDHRVGDNTTEAEDATYFLQELGAYDGAIEALRLLKPPLDVDNQRFWFEFLAFDFPGYDEPSFRGFSYSSHDLEEHAKSLPMVALSALLDEIVQEEDAYMRHARGDQESQLRKHEVSHAVLSRWANVNLAPGNTTSAEEAVAFCTMLAVRGDELQIDVLQRIMRLVGRAAESNDLETVKRIASAFA